MQRADGDFFVNASDGVPCTVIVRGSFTTPPLHFGLIKGEPGGE